MADWFNSIETNFKNIIVSQQNRLQSIYRQISVNPFVRLDENKTLNFEILPPSSNSLYVLNFLAYYLGHGGWGYGWGWGPPMGMGFGGGFGHGGGFHSHNTTG